jgi:hypothetical protein
MPHSRAPMMAGANHKARIGDDGEGRKTRARPGRNRSPRRELQGNPAEVRTRACRVLRNDLGQCVERIGAALILALRWNRQKIARPSRYPRRNMARGTTSEFHQEMPPAKFAAAGTKPVLRRFSVKCSNLARGESMKDPVCIFECRRGFSLWSGRPETTRSRAMRSGGSDHRITQELTQPLRSLVAGKGVSCPCGWKL